MLRQISWELTTRCYLECPHCMIAASPRGRSVAIAEAAKILGHLPGDRAYGLELSGGDPFVDYPLLVAVVEQLGGRQPPRRVTVHTTGQWARNHEVAERRFRHLAKLGVDGIDFLCDDPLHEAGGLLSERFDTAVGAARAVFGSRMILVRSTDCQGEIIPLGRGATESMRRYWGRSKCNVKGLDFELNMQFHIAHTGDAYLCDNMVAPSIGSMLRFSYEQLVLSARRDSCHRALVASGPLGLVRESGLDEERWSSQIEEVGECRACIQLFRDYSGPIGMLSAQRVLE